MTDDAQLIALINEIDTIEARIEALRPTVVGVTGRVATYSGVLIALTVGVVDSAYMLPWIAGALAIACVPDARRWMRSRALARQRDSLLREGAGFGTGGVTTRAD